MLITPLFLLALAAASPATPAQNAGAVPFAGDHMWRTFHGQAGVDRIVDDLVATNARDPRIADIFRGQDLDHLRAMLKEQFCFILGGGCTYSGKSMKDGHKDLGIQRKDMNALVDNLQRAMAREKIPFAAQNRFVAKLAPMQRDVVVR